MVQEFYINTSATLPVLRMELISDGRNDYDNFYDALKDADITFSMRDTETGILKVSEAAAERVLAKDTGCEEKYILEYKWNERDTRKPGIYKGWFTINFNGHIGDAGKLIVPIQEELHIYIK